MRAAAEQVLRRGECFRSAFGLRKVFIEGRSPAHEWEDLEKYEKEYEHPYWAKGGEQAKATGHGGGDWFVISDFLQAVRSGVTPIDIYDAVTWTSVRPLSEQSIRSGNQPVEIPDFRKM